MEEKALKDLYPMYREFCREDSSDPDSEYAAEELRAEWYAEMDREEEYEQNR